MVHNGIEYGIMAAYAEGLYILRQTNIGKSESRGAAYAPTTQWCSPTRPQRRT